MINIHRFTRSFGYALEGILHIFKFHQNIRFHMLIAVLALLLAAFLRIGHIEFLFILLAIFLVIISEMINTAIEEMTNLITTEHRKEAKIAKDVASAAVLLSSVMAIIIGLVIFIPHL